MKNQLITIASMLTMLLALGGCDFGSNGNDNADQPNANAQLDCQLNQYLFHQPVEQVAGNTLDNTPADIQNLVSGFDIDIRNSVYSILQQVNNESYTYGEGKERDLYFSMGSIIQPIMGDAGVSNAMAKDYNECIRSIGVERLNQGEGRQCGEQWGRSWKAQVIDKLLASPSLQNSLYDWVKPELQRVFNGFNSDQRTLMSNAMNHMIQYTANYNHQAEKKFYNDCCSSPYGADLFVHPGKIVDMAPVDDEITSPYRFLETWVYRRVEDGTMSAEQINQWLKKIKADTGI